MLVTRPDSRRAVLISAGVPDTFLDLLDQIGDTLPHESDLYMCDATAAYVYLEDDSWVPELECATVTPIFSSGNRDTFAVYAVDESGVGRFVRAYLYEGVEEEWDTFQAYIVAWLIESCYVFGWTQDEFESAASWLGLSAIAEALYGDYVAASDTDFDLREFVLRSVESYANS